MRQLALYFLYFGSWHDQNLFFVTKNMVTKRKDFVFYAQMLLQSENIYFFNKSYLSKVSSGSNWAHHTEMTSTVLMRE